MFARLSRADQEHHLRVARRFCDRAGVMAPREWVAAALLHDVGKLECGLGTVGRVSPPIIVRVGRSGSSSSKRTRVTRVSPWEEPNACGGENRSMPSACTPRLASW